MLFSQRIRAVLEWAIAMDLQNDNNPCDRVVPVLGPQNDIVTHWQALPQRLGSFQKRPEGVNRFYPDALRSAVRSSRHSA